MVQPPDELAELVRQADLIVVPATITVLQTGPEPEQPPPAGREPGSPPVPVWQPRLPWQVVEVLVDRTMLGRSTSPDPSVLVVHTLGGRRSGPAGPGLLFLQRMPEPGHYRELRYTLGTGGPFTQEDLVGLADARWARRLRWYASRDRGSLRRKLGEVRRSRGDVCPSAQGPATGPRRPARELPAPVPWPAVPPDLDPAVVDGSSGVDPGRWLLRWRQPHCWALPSGRVVVGERDDDEPWLHLELGDDVVATVDLEDVRELGVVELVLRSSRGDEATVRYDDRDGGRLALVPAPAGRHSADCSCRDDERVAQLRAWLGWEELAPFVDLLAGLPRDLADWSLPAHGAPLWRGRRDRRGLAVVELLTDDAERVEGAGRYDGRLDDRRLEVVATASVGLRPPPGRFAFPVSGDVSVVTVPPPQQA